MTIVGPPQRVQGPDTVSVFCDAPSHDGRRWKIATFVRDADGTHWQEIRFASAARRAERAAWQVDHPQQGLPEGPFDFEAMLEGFAPAGDAPTGTQHLTGDRESGGAVPSPGHRQRFSKRCNLCGDSIAVRWEKLSPILDRLAEAGIKMVTLRGLAATLR